MKKNKFITAVIALIASLNSGSVYAQVSTEEAAKYIEMFTTNQVDKAAVQKAIQEKGTKVGIFMPYIALKFSTGISSYNHYLNGLTPNAAYAMLDTDTAVFQEITDEFYALLAKKIATTGIRVVDFESVNASAIYTDLAAQPISERFFRDVWLGESRICTQKNAPIVRLPNNPSPKMSKWMNSLKATPCVLRLVVDFMEYKPLLVGEAAFSSVDIAGNQVVLVIKISASDDKDNNLIHFYEGSKVSIGSDKSKTADVAPGFLMGGYMTDNLYFHNNAIYESFKYKEIANLKDNNLADWATSLNNKYQVEINNNSFERWAVQIEREEYKRAVMAALDKYSDYLVALIKANQTK